MESRRPLFTTDAEFADDVFSLSTVIDGLVEERVGLDGLVTAVVERLRRSVRVNAFGRVVHFLPTEPPTKGLGEPHAGRLASSNITVAIDPPLPERAGKLVTQRLVHATRMLLHQDPAPSTDDGEKLRWLLSAVVTAEERHAIREALGLRGEEPVTVLAVAGVGEDCAAAERLATRTSPEPVLVTRVGELLAVVVRGVPNTEIDVPAGMSVGIGETVSAQSLHTSWASALTALRFSMPSRRDRGPYRLFDAVIVDIANVGVLRVLAESVAASDVTALADVQGITQLAENGPEDSLAVMEAVAATDSIRQAAQLVHLHHNTVAHRVRDAENVLGFSLTVPYGRTRLMVGLILYRVAVGNL